ncbi:unnamed protein product [Bursaphelenchus okinawaensis]|uniref:Chromatin target of PRMT1 protein C-terminal domain-containing protein n=1 Tax=Bursaphelenchus okinawaensis TaxID=465554 RepID=A0A811JR44_9BILA|nr:unnamed protein product [Bursaphelenchus okinawaensis]CAG9079355.1 unnamed protein product [Bursaphelenchus okinawaensis]
MAPRNATSAKDFVDMPLDAYRASRRKTVAHAKKTNTKNPKKKPVDFKIRPNDHSRKIQTKVIKIVMNVPVRKTQVADTKPRTWYKKKDTYPTQRTNQRIDQHHNSGRVNKNKAAFKSRKPAQPKVNLAELDKELDAYMKSSKHYKQ